MMETLTHSYIGSKLKHLIVILVVLLSACSKEDDLVQPQQETKPLYKVAAPLEIEGTYRRRMTNGLAPSIVTVKHIGGNLVTVNQDTAKLINPHRLRGLTDSINLSATYANGILNHCRTYIDSTTGIDYYICQTLRK